MAYHIKPINTMYNNSFNSKTDYIFLGDEEEVKFSCDPLENSWAYVNRNNYQNISRSELVRYPLTRQYTIFNTLSFSNRIRIFSEKIYLITKGENFTAQENDHLLSLIAFMKPEYYKERYQEKVESFYNIWKIKAAILFNWSEEMSEIYAETWLTKDELDFAVRKEYSTRSSANRPGGEGGSPDCMCRYDWYCGGISGDCSAKKQCRKVGGCGIFGTSSCKGLCSPGEAGFNVSASSSTYNIQTTFP